MPRRAVIYARLSVAKEQSVSVERQVRAARDYASAQGWEVIGDPFIDEGVSASSVRPEKRAGWSALAASTESFDTVLVWKIDRLARRVLDFLHVHETLQGRGAGVVSVTEPIDMTTAQGRAFATMLALFGEMEAEAIRARVKGARDYLIQSGRVVGGTVPYGWRSVPIEGGAGFRREQDPDRIDYVRQMAARALDGQSIYSIAKWLEETNAPLPATSQARRKHPGRWSYTTVERLLRNPVLAGMTPFQPGRQKHDRADPWAVLRDERGLPRVDASIAILTTDERRQLLDRLDNRDSPQAAPKASRATTSPLLAGLADCHECSRKLQRGTTQGRPSLSCPSCSQTISRKGLDEFIIAAFLRERGGLPLWRPSVLHAEDPARLSDIERAIDETTAQMRTDGADVDALAERLKGLLELRTHARLTTSRRTTWRLDRRTVAEAWADADDDEQRRSLLQTQLKDLQIRRGRRGRGFDESRVLITWRAVPAGRPLPDGVRVLHEHDGLPIDGRVGPVMVTLPGGDVLYVSDGPPTSDPILQ